MASLNSVRGSMLWAAYGDALGFMSELVNRGGLVERTGADHVTQTIPWQYRVGGRFGVTVRLPPGAYSDDTQLRLATGRAISSGGRFNVDAFSKVELPCWLSYALGGGKGTKAAAANLAKENVTWFTNFYSLGPVNYVGSGGNGAAMRVQPHAWAASDRLGARELIIPVVRNVVTTHGHSRALIGSILYALVLTDTLRNSQISSPSRYIQLLEIVKELPGFIADDDYLSSMWLPEWERRSNTRFSDAITATVEECRLSIGKIPAQPNSPYEEYTRFVTEIDGFNPKTRGSGTSSVVAALAVSWLFRHDPPAGILAAANLIGSDTDTIASMAGALLGTSASDPPGQIQDKQLLVDEAERLWRISEGQNVRDFPYPSLLEWRAPKGPLDAVGHISGRIALAGFGPLTPTTRESYTSNERNPSTWRWARTTFGQTILVKMRDQLPELDHKQLPIGDLSRSAQTSDKPGQKPKETSTFGVNSQRSLFDTGYERAPSAGVPNRNAPPQRDQNDLDRYTQDVIRSNFDPTLIGRILLELSENSFGIESAMGFAAIVAKARRSRAKVSRV